MATILSLLPTYAHLLTFSVKTLEGMLPTAAYYARTTRVPEYRDAYQTSYDNIRRALVAKNAASSSR